jgi:succinate dehydrogenase/fumarate reductase flavoprotein subunit
MLRNWGERIIFRRGLDLSNGNALIARLLRSATDVDVSVLTGTTVASLRVEDGAVTGANVTGPDGQLRAVQARHGVVLACGGFSHSKSLRERFFPHGADHYSPTASGNSGDNYQLGVPAGADFDTNVEQPAAWAPVTVFNGPHGRKRVFPHLRGVGLPGVIAVDRRGRRFVNESNSYHQFCQAMLAANDGEDDPHAFLIADARTMHKYGLGFAKPWPFPRLRYYWNGYLRSGRTLRKLAQRAGIDPVGLEATVAEFNAGVQEAADPLFGRGEDEFNWFKGDMSHKPNPSLAPVAKGPYYATKVSMGDLGTFAGLATDEHGRALRHDGTSIPGLYAAGSAAVSLFGGAYPGHGANLGPAMTSGYAIGRLVSTGLPTAAYDSQTGATG